MARFFFFLIFLICATGSQAQIEGLFVPQKKAVKRGTVYFANGETMKFSTLNFRNDRVVFTDQNGTSVSEPLANINQIDGKIDRVGMGALIGGLSGLLAGVVAGSIAYPDRSFGEWLLDELTGEEYDRTMKKEEIPIIVGCTLAGTAIGALAGKGRKEKTVFKRNADIDVFPGMTATPGEANVFSLHLRVSLH